MSITRIPNPFQGEHVVGVAPAPSARVSDWNRRLNLFTGRALSDTALTAEQDGRNGRVALAGQTVSPGVISGLEVALEKQGDADILNIGSGYGICASGEDVFVNTGARLPVRSLPVYTTAALLDGAAPLGTGALAARRLGGTLDEVIAAGIAVPKAGIIVLEPVQVDQLANFDATDPCVEDPTSTAFSDEQLLDGARLVYYAWPDEWLLLPAPGAQWRNRLAFAIFDSESANEPAQVMPWELIGLPIALIGMDDAFNALFVDRYSVVRHGGRAKRRTAPTPGSGHEFLWQARIQQFAEEVTSFNLANPDNPDASLLAAEFRYLPPAGLLPKNALTFVTGAPASGTRVSATTFFPGSYDVTAVPVPVEQLDLIARRCGPLADFDMSSADQVTVAVPVPQIWYEPELLQVLGIDPVFQQTVDQFDHLRSIWLKRRADVRAAYALLAKAATGTAATFPDPDPDAVEAETIASTEIDDAIDAFKTAEDTYGTAPAAAPPTVTTVESLKTTLNAMSGVSAEVPQLDALGLSKFADLLQAKSDAANDHIDLGFLRVQTDIYRTRQKMLSEEAATRLAVSPALASIAEGVSAAASKEDLNAFLQSAKITLNTPSPVTPAPPAAPSAPASGSSTSRSSINFAAALGNASVFVNPVIPVERITNVPVREDTQTATFTSATNLFTASSNLTIAATAATVGDVTQGRAIVGAGYDLRTTSVVERLQDPKTSEVKTSTLSSKYNVVSTFAKGGITFDGASQAGMNVGDIEIPGFRDDNGNEIRKKFSDISDGVLGEILSGKHDTLPDNPAESDIFAVGVRAMENTIDVLRLMESRVQLYRQAAQLCRNTLVTVSQSSSAALGRLQAISNGLGDARHDVAFAKALMAEEQTRIDGINSRRDQIISNEVRFLAYFRPRTIEARTDLPTRSVDPGLTTPVIPACLARNLTAPDELRAYVNLLREAPLNWFITIPILLDKFDRLDILQTVVQNSKARAGFKLAQTVPTAVQTAPGPLGIEISRVFSSQQLVMNTARQAVAQTDLTAFAGASWAASRDRAASLLSIGDLMDLGHYRPEVPRVSAAEIENILKVSACLYSDLTGVLPVIRLNWAERLLQAGATLNLANLASLPRWGEVPVLERKEMQAIVDWLFSRIQRSQPDAVSHINDLIRVAILLASHAPVSDIIAGDVIRDTTVKPGSRIDLTADLSRVRLGMQVLVYQESKPVARAVVEDLSTGVATARVLTSTSASVTISKGTRVQYATQDAFARNPITAALM